jgi:hypothetical protein
MRARWEVRRGDKVLAEGVAEEAVKAHRAACDAAGKMAKEEAQQPPRRKKS